MIDLFAFYSNPETLKLLQEAEIDGIIIDWETKGKTNRQSLYNTQVNEHTSDDLALVSRTTIKNIICRINGPEYWSIDEINNAIELGATEILVPMIKTIEEVDKVVTVIDNRCKIGLMLETNESLNIADQLNDLPINRFFVGLNDLSIQRKSRNLFQPFVDGTLKELRPKINKHFGVAGLTHPNAGHPIPCSHLINQMKEYEVTFGFLRRAFYKDLDNYSVKEILTSIRREFDSIHKSKLSQSEERELFVTELI